MGIWAEIKEANALASVKKGVDLWLPKVAKFAETFADGTSTANHYNDGTPYGSAVRDELRRLAPAAKQLASVFESFVAALEEPSLAENVAKARAQLADSTDGIVGMIDFATLYAERPDSPGAAELQAKFLELKPEVKQLLVAAMTWLEVVEPEAGVFVPRQPQLKRKSSQFMN